MEPGDLAILTAPNNPTGLLPDLEDLVDLARRRPECLLVCGSGLFAPGHSYPGVAGRSPNLSYPGFPYQRSNALAGLASWGTVTGDI